MSKPNGPDMEEAYFDFFNRRNWKRFQVSDMQIFKHQILEFSRSFDPICCLDHNQYPNSDYHSFDALFGIGAQAFIRPDKDRFESLKSFVDKQSEFLFGYLSYDLKNEIEKLESRPFDPIGFPDLHFFVPEIWIGIRGNEAIIALHDADPEDVYSNILEQGIPDVKNPKIEIHPRMGKEEYLRKVNTIKNHILEGDIYEMNFCQEFYAENAELDPWQTFHDLNNASKAPFASFYRNNNQFLIGGSPERFLKKEKQQLISQPIKGTIKRGRNTREDQILKSELETSEKDRAENVMIVDLVRNDLAKSCLPGSVQVEELFGIYEFEKVFQMISTVSGTLRPETHLVDAIKNAFPMGSMTGAPKVRSMQLIETYEQSRRGLYSGSVGYIDPKGDFDFNVVIRSILYQAETKYLSFQVGGAIVYDSVPEKEYEECLLKASNVIQILGLESIT